jgi:hypothetical protein
MFTRLAGFLVGALHSGEHTHFGRPFFMTHRFPGPQFAVSHESIREKPTVLKNTLHKFQISRQTFLLYFGKGNFGGKKITLHRRLFEILINKK